MAATSRAGDADCHRSVSHETYAASSCSGAPSSALHSSLLVFFLSGLPPHATHNPPSTLPALSAAVYKDASLSHARTDSTALSMTMLSDAGGGKNGRKEMHTQIYTNWRDRSPSLLPIPLSLPRPSLPLINQASARSGCDIDGLGRGGVRVISGRGDGERRHLPGCYT